MCRDIQTFHACDTISNNISTKFVCATTVLRERYLQDRWQLCLHFSKIKIITVDVAQDCVSSPLDSLNNIHDHLKAAQT